MFSWRRLLPVLIAALMWGTAGCGNATVSEPQESLSTRYSQYIAGGLDSAETAEVEAIIFNEIQNEIAICMLSEGFEYVPEDDPTRFVTPPRAFFTAEDVEAHGFGIVASFRDLENATGIGINDIYVRDLDDANQQAYFDALEGETVGPQAGGCIGEAQATAFETLGISKINDLQAQGVLANVDENPLLVAADQEWRSCVSDLGISTGASSLPDYLVNLDDEFEAIDKSDEAAVQEFQDREIELASLMLDCNAKRNDVLVAVVTKAIDEG